MLWYVTEKLPLGELLRTRVSVLIFSFLSYNLVFLFNVCPGFFLCNVEKTCAMLARYLQHQVIIKKTNRFKIKIA